MDTSVSSFTTASFDKAATRPSNANRQSTRAEALQLCIGSGFFIDETSIQYRTTLFSNGRICLAMKFSPKSPPENQSRKLPLRDEHFIFRKVTSHTQRTENTNSNQHINSISTQSFPKTVNQRQNCLQ